MAPPQKMEIGFDQQSRRIMERLTRALEAATPKPAEHYDDNTLFKARDCLMEAGLTSTAATEIIGSMQNAGILFRERTPSG